MVMMMTLMVNKFNCSSNYGLFVICPLACMHRLQEEMEEVGKMVMIKTLMVKQVGSLNCSSNYGFFVQTF